MLGKFLASPLRILNVPVRAAENLAGVEDEEERVASRPVDELAKELEKALGD